MKIQTIFLTVSIMATLAISSCSNSATDKDFIGKSTTKFESDLLTPEALWSLGRIGSVQVAPDSKTAVYNVTYYSIEQNKSHSVLYTQSLDEKENKILTATNDNERNAVFYDGGKKVLFLSNKSGSQQLWSMNADGSGRKQVSDLTDDISEFLLSPDEKQIVLIMEVEDTTNIQKNDEDLPLSSGIVINDFMYKHWDQFVKTIPHPFLAEFDGKRVTVKKDILDTVIFHVEACAQLEKSRNTAVDLDFALCGGEHAGYDLKKSGFSRAVGTDYTYGLSPLYIKVYVIEGKILCIKLSPARKTEGVKETRLVAWVELVHL